MQGTIAQIVALTTHGNAFLGGPSRAASFPRAHSTLQYCEYVRFVDLKPKAGGWEETPYADDASAWFARLRRDEVSGLRLVYLPSTGEDRMRVGFIGGGGRWLMEALTPDGADLWEARWETGDKERKDQRIWRVTYGRIARRRPSAHREGADVAVLGKELAGCLGAIGAFARKQKLSGFAKSFAAGLAKLSARDPLAGGYHDDLAPRGALPLPAAQLLGAVQAAWVFGGMGSWNDLGFSGEDAAVYERLSEELFQLFNQAIAAAASSTAPAARSAAKPRRKARS
jgi:hypothetical protein